MLHWLVQSSDAHPDLRRGIPPAGLLGESEYVHFQGLKSDKRRHDWLIGRWTAKKLVQSVLGRRGLPLVSLDSVRIRNAESGEPYVHAPGYPVTLSISHSADHAFCALIEQVEWPLGVDLEQITPRNDWFVKDFFTPAEQLNVNAALMAERSTLVTAIWSAKEATLKALHLGLTVDTRWVNCSIVPNAAARQGWIPFQVGVRAECLNRPIPFLTGWWRIVEPYVMTLVTETDRTLNLRQNARTGYN